MIAKNLIYNLRDSLESAGSQVNNYTDQFLMYMLDEARATLASQKMDAKVNVIHMAQHIDASTGKPPSNELGAVGDTRVLSVDIPNPISYLNGCGIFTVGSTDGEESYTQITYSQLRTSLHRRYTGTGPKWMYFNNKLYLINVDISAASKVRVHGIFDRPVDVIKAKGQFKHLTPFEFSYPLAMKDEKTIYQLAFQSTLGWGDTAVQSINAQSAKANKDNELLTALKDLKR